MDEEKGRNLAQFRSGENKHMGKEMTEEEKKTRREFMRIMLRGVEPWQKLTDSQLDDVRIHKICNDWYIEDKDYYEYMF